jgi:simple sugar transport system ATP-binding protein
MMVGRELGAAPQRAARAPGAARIVVEGLAVADASGVKRLKDASFVLHAGEILAIAGVDGNGQAELADALAGMVKPLAGRIMIDGRDVTATGVGARLAAGIAYIPADRARTSLVQAMSIADNLALRDFQRPPLARRGRLDTALMAKQAIERIRAFAVRTPSPDLPVRGLSGGNQQKVVLAREIGRVPEVLIAFQPTWGLDPGATRFVIEQVLAVRDRGGAVLYLSAELEEVLALGDRIGVISDGRIAEIVVRAAVDIGRIGLLMGGSAAEAAHAA